MMMTLKQLGTYQIRVKRSDGTGFTPPSFAQRRLRCRSPGFRLADPSIGLFLQFLHKRRLPERPTVQGRTGDGLLLLRRQPRTHHVGVRNLSGKWRVAQVPVQRMRRDAAVVGLADVVAVAGPGVG